MGGPQVNNLARETKKKKKKSSTPTVLLVARFLDKIGSETIPKGLLSTGGRGEEVPPRWRYSRWCAIIPGGVILGGVCHPRDVILHDVP